MRQDETRLRSLLYVPGSSERMIGKARETRADAVILDLEDGVAPALKAEARETVARALREMDFGGRDVYVRINSLAHGDGLEDARAAVDHGAQGIVIPKAESLDDVTTIAPMLHSGYGKPSGRLLLMIETPRGVLATRALAESNDLVVGVMFGAADLSRELGAQPNENEDELLWARSQVLLAARAAGVAAYDSPHFAIEDADGLRRRCLAARRLGYDGKAVIHPGQIDVVNEVFASTPAEIAEAERVVAAMAEAHAAGRGVILLDGKMIDQVHLATARKVLARAGIK